MTFTQAIKSGFANFANFKGVASRSEFWLWILFVTIGRVVFAIFGFAGTTDPDSNPIGMFVRSQGAPALAWSLLVLLPTFAVAVRRLRDAGKNPKILFVGLIPAGLWFVVGAAAVIATISVLTRATAGNGIPSADAPFAAFAPIIVFAGFAGLASLAVGGWLAYLLAKPSQAPLT